VSKVARRVKTLSMEFVADDWLVTTSGHHAIIGRLTAPRADVRPIADGRQMLAWIEACQSAPRYPAAGLLEAVKPLPCELCKGKRFTACRLCDGGKVRRTCDHCDHYHACVCGMCEDGEIDCSCLESRPILVLGRCFDAWLVHDLLSRLGVDAQEAIQVYMAPGPREPMLFHVKADGARAKSLIGLVMPVLFDGRTPSWWAEPVAS
jgi:hypothetical protein